MVMESIGALLNRAAKLDNDILSLEEKAAILKAERDRIYEDEIPSILHEHGLLAAPLEDGRTVTLKQVVNVKQGDKAALARWLEENDYDAVIKTSLEFPKGSDTSQAEDLLKMTGVDYVKETFVHPQILKKVMGDHLANGGDYPPDEAATVTIYERASVKER